MTKPRTTWQNWPSPGGYPKWYGAGCARYAHGGRTVDWPGNVVVCRKRRKARIARRDERDWPAVAASLLLDCPIWTEDRDFFGAGVAAWTTETISIYLDTC
ncbi:PIN domain-containing protein [Acidithiobacillus ferriphilus]